MRIPHIIIYICFAVMLGGCAEKAAQVPNNKLPDWKKAESEVMVAYNDTVRILETEEIRQYADSEWGKSDSTLTGIRYRIKAKGFGRKPVIGDKITICYSVAPIDGDVCDELKDKRETIVLGQSDMPKGIEESIGLIEEGGIGEFLIPSMWAYSYYGKGGCINAQTPIRCKIIVEQINKK